MTRHLALLRGVNVGGKTLPMKELVALCETIGWLDVRSYIQSGNVVFGLAPGKGGVGDRGLASILEGAIKERFALEVAVLLRSRAELRRIAESNPFLAPVAGGDPASPPTGLHVTFLAQAPSAAKTAALVPSEVGGTVRDGKDEFILRGTELFLHCPDGYGRTKFNNSYFERKLGVAATTRNWATVMKLLELVEA